MKLLLLCLLLCGCTPNTLKVEAEHVSHPTAGWPISDRYTEDGLTQVSAIAHWQREAAYLDAGIGYNVRGVNGGGFYGPAFTGTVRVGIEIRLK